MSTLIVGGGQAAAQIAASLRAAGDTAPIRIVGAEPHPPYQRPPLSKAYLLGHADRTGLALRSPAFYADRGIEVRTGERVVSLTPTQALTDRGATIGFERLALTTGARPRRLPVPGADLAGVHVLRDLAHADRLRAALPGAARVVVVGGGFVGLEAAAVARALGAEVTVVEAADRLIGRSVGPLLSEFYRRAHERRGTAVLLGSEVAGVSDGSVSLADGRELPADLVLVGIGADPRTELAEQLGLTCAGGIVVDEDARTSRPGVVAAGDCAVRDGVRLESVQNAVAQAKVAAATLAGRPRPAVEVPWFWSDQHDLKLQIAGLPAGYDETVVRGDPDGERFAVLYYRSGALVAVEAVNSPADYLAVRKALGAGLAVPADRARASDRPLKDLLIASSGGPMVLLFSNAEGGR